MGSRRIKQYCTELFGEFTHGTMSQRDLMDRLARLAGGADVAAAFSPILQNNRATASIVPENEERLVSEQPESTGRVESVVFLEKHLGQ
jgi:carboxymethylenebutenolidase